MTMGTTWIQRVAAGAAAVAIAALATVAASPHAAAGMGTWTLDTSANPSTFNRFDGDSCPTATHCVAVGFQEGGEDPDRTLVEVWTGTDWTVQSSANIDAQAALQTNVLNAISCVSTTDCWAVGYYSDNSVGKTQPLREHWDGTAWTASTLATPVASNFVLNGVSCVNSTNCWAVGNVTVSSAAPYIEYWNGSTWTPQAITAEVAGSLDAVSCADTSHCKAVGHDAGVPSAAIILSYNGTTWTADTAAGIATGDELTGVSCTSPTNCWAVGHYDAPGITRQNLIESWNGTAWTLSPTLADNNNGSVLQNNELLGVACTTATSCWASGYYQPGTSPVQTLIDTWNGTAWTVVASTPNAAVTGDSDILYGIGCGVTGLTTHCAAVGEYGPPDPTLAVGITVTAVTPAPTPLPTPNTGAPSPGAGLPVGVVLVTGGALAAVGAVAMRGRRRRQPLP